MKTVPPKPFPSSLGTTKMLLEKVPVHVKNNFKAACAKRGVTMQDASIRFFRHYDSLHTKLVLLEAERRREEAADANAVV